MRLPHTEYLIAAFKSLHVVQWSRGVRGIIADLYALTPYVFCKDLDCRFVSLLDPKNSTLHIFTHCPHRLLCIGQICAC